MRIDKICRIRHSAPCWSVQASPVLTLSFSLSFSWWQPPLLSLLLAVLLGINTSAATAAMTAAPIPPGFEDVPLATVAQATDLAFTPDHRLLVTEQTGHLTVWTGSSPLQVALDLEDIVCTDKERGLLGVAVDPAFQTNHYIYLYYTFKNDSNCGAAPEPTPINRLSRFILSDQNIVNPASEFILLNNIPAVMGIHNAGSLNFGKDGLLYVSIGDSGCHYQDYYLCGIYNKAAQQLNALSGKILRITPDGKIPSTNPYLGSDSVRCNATGRAEAGKKCQEIFASGLRNPYRLAFDPNTAQTRFFVNDVGGGKWEEINLGQSGANYGWNVREGNCVVDSYFNCGGQRPDMVNPLFEYQHVTGCSAITGGAFIPNDLWPSEYNGGYLYGDWVCGKIFLLTAPSGVYTATEFVTNASGVTAMTFGPYENSQALYYLDYGFPGELHRLTYVGFGNRAPSAELSANPTYGIAPLAVTLDASGSSDPDAADTLTYIWDFGDGSAATDSSTPIIVHTYVANGSYTASLKVRDSQGALSVQPATVKLSPGNTPPVPTIISPDPQLRFAVSQVITLQGSATDPQDGPLPDSALTWQVLRHHNTHYHPYMPVTSGNGITFAGPPPEELTAESQESLDIVLTATDSQGLSQSITRTLLPNSVPLVITSNPPGLPLTLDDESITGPHLIVSRQGLGLDIEAPEIFIVGDQPMLFESWSDGGAPAHTLFTPAAPGTYTATYVAAPNVVGLLKVNRMDLSYSLSGNSFAPAGVLGINVRLSNSSDTDISGIFFRVRRLSGGYMLNADAGPAGTGAIVSLPPDAMGTDGVLQPGESFLIAFRIGLTSLSRLRLVLDAYGLPQDATASGTGGEDGISLDITPEQIQQLIEGNTLYLPGVKR
jgi:glucose/arabinose dehydrogenase